MIFSSFTFLVFFLGVAALTGIAQRWDAPPRVRHGLLLIASYVFYGWWDARFCFLMAGMTLVAYLSSVKKDVPFFRVLGIVAPLAALGFFKYFNFFVQSFCDLFGLAPTGGLAVILPVGISFFTFQSLSYTLDVQRGEQAPAGLLSLALYISFFPQLVAGPIVKASDFLPQLGENRRMTLKSIETGLQIFLFGLFKKVVLADHLSVFVDEVFFAPAAFDAFTLALAVAAYSLQIYFDFSGYSDMAIGAAKCFGYDFKPNFNMPYIAQNLSAFWKRWHISLSRWLQQYLYIPLGGNRKGPARTYLHLMLTMTLGGLWHGADWTFVAWGLWHGAGLCAHKWFARRFPSGGRPAQCVSVLCTYVFVCVGWVFFRAENFGQAFAVLRGIVTGQPGVRHIFVWVPLSLVLAAAGTVAAILRGKGGRPSSANGFYPLNDLNTVKGLFILFVVTGLILALAYAGSRPFIYFQF